MSITDDLRACADTATEFVDRTRHNMADLTSKIVEDAGGAITQLRGQVEKAVDVDAIKSAAEPYLSRAKGYTDSAATLYTTVRSDKRVAPFADTAETVAGVVVDTVTERVVKPLQSMAGFGDKPSAEPSDKPFTEPAAEPSDKPSAEQAPPEN